MRLFLMLFLVLTNVCSQAQTFDALNISLLDRWHQDSLITNSTQARYSDCYGFTWNNDEYAVIGSTEGTHIFQIQSNNSFLPVGYLKGRFSNTSVVHRDYATYQHYLYAVCDEGISSLQIIDFQYLPDSIHLVYEDSVQFGRVHNIFIDSSQHTLYSLTHRSVTNTQAIEAPMKLFSLQDPTHLTELWSGPDDVNEVHDAYVRNGRAYLNCGYDGLRVYDFTNTSNPNYISSLSFYQDQGFNHQGWLTPNGELYLFADETAGKRVKSYRVDADNLSFHAFFDCNATSGSVPHNIMADDDFAYVAYYNEGFRIFDLRQQPPIEVAHFDSYPKSNDPYPMNGNWGVYSLLPSKRMLLADRQNGLFLVQFHSEAVPKTPIETFTIAPNPSSGNQMAQLFMPSSFSSASYQLVDATGRIIEEQNFELSSMLALPTHLSNGVYFLFISYTEHSLSHSMVLKWEKL